MGVLAKGTTYSDGDTVSPANLQALVESAVLSGVTRGQIDQGSISLLTEDQDIPPGPYEGEVWQDRDSSTPFIGVYDGSNFIASHSDVFRCRAVSGVSLSKGDVVRFSSASTLDLVIINIHQAASEQNYFGVCLVDFSSGGFGYVQVSGFCNEVRVTGSVSVGDGLGGASGSNGRFESKGSRTGFDVHAIARTANASGDGVVKAWLLD